MVKTIKLLLFGLANVLALACPYFAQATGDADDSTAIPGIGFGIVKLGTNREQITKTMGKRDGAYSLPGGIKVEYSQWIEPKKTFTMRVFFDAQGKAVQLSAEKSLLATKDGITYASSLTDVEKKYKNLQCFKYRAQATRINYYDDVKQGITFAFAWADVDGEASKHMYAILVHKPGMRVIADADEHPVNR